MGCFITTASQPHFRMSSRVSKKILFKQLNKLGYVGFDVLTAVIMKSSIFSMYVVYSTERQLTFQRNMLLPSSGSKIILSLFFDAEDGGKMFL